MHPAEERLVVREHERVRCSLRAVIEPAPEMRDLLRLARGVGNGSGSVDAELTDCSGGGVGLRSPVYFPKQCVLMVRVPSPDGGAGGHVFEGRVRVQRATMIGREPAYDLGAAFADRPDERTLEALLKLSRAGARVEGEDRGA
ncbi:MAG: PilZ domain-containing protein [Planctomycetota bacterium]|nr:PilZ domain-containing protein [Planctomycetota bacterium]